MGVAELILMTIARRFNAGIMVIQANRVPSRDERSAGERDAFLSSLTGLGGVLLMIEIPALKRRAIVGRKRRYAFATGKRRVW
jgi:hypothetical protein